MSLDRRVIFALACLLAPVLDVARANQDSRKSRSIVISDRYYQPRGNLIRTEEGGYYSDGKAHSAQPIYYDRGQPFDDTVVILSPAITAQDDGKIREEEEKIFRDIMTKDYHVSSPADIEEFDRIGERIIARANITEEAKRVVRQVKKQRPGFFWTLARVTFEAVNETQSAIQQISNIVSSAISPETTTVRGGMNAALTTNATSTTARIPTSGSNSTEETTTTTTQEPFRLTRTGLQGIIRRNLRGLVRLFNIEWQDALNQSQTNVREFQRDLGNQISPFLQDNPDVV